MLAGTGYFDGELPGHGRGVKSAVNAFAASFASAELSRGLQVRVTLDPVAAWFVVKGCVAPRSGTRKVAVLTAYDDAMAKVAAISSPNKAANCARHGYDFVQRTAKDFDRSRPPAWSKLRFVADLLPYYDWVFWTDCDSLVLDPTCPLEAFLLDERRSHLILPHDDLGVGVHHVNTGNFFVRNSKWAARFLDEAWRQVEFVHDRLWENRSVVIHLLERSDYSQQVQVVTQRRFNSFPNHCQAGTSCSTSPT